MRIGYFGGTFDPPHCGHLAVARAAADAFALHRVLFAPTGRQPLKPDAPHAEYLDRLAMTKLLCLADERFEASELEAPHADGSANFTVETLRTLRDSDPAAEIFVIVGADSFLSLRRWRDPEELLQMAEWIVVSRPEHEVDDLSPLALTPEQRDRVHLLTTLDDPTSATEIRARLRCGVTPEKQLTPEVLLYIARMRLYHAAR